MINLYVSYHCGTKEKRTEFYQALKELGRMCSREDGCLGYDYFFSAEDEGLLLLLEHWADQAALDKHGSLDTFRKIGEVKETFGVKAEVKKVIGDYE